ncbi:unnamed protein product [Prorocentrum cordatum]|uniref:Pre-mRNA-splicing factor 18 n=1 Tax=Prorocentrum cordatum TaxID=2364126 RepID=A0ABN9SY07_9DINO|nr:unnamed protein product [Polarella glacialis]
MEAAAPVAERSLVSSSLHREDVLVGGHAAVWGSFFDPEARRWGFACCRGTARLEPCPEAKAAARPKRKAEEEEEEEDPKAKAARSAFWSSRLLDGEPPDSPPGAREESDCAEDFLAAFVLYWFHAWASGSGAEARPDARAVQQTKEALLPLLQQLKARTLPQPLLRQLADFAELAGQREYSQANDVYVAITIGKALWHTHLDLGQQRAHWGGGSSLRTMQKQIVEKQEGPQERHRIRHGSRRAAVRARAEAASDPHRGRCAQRLPLEAGARAGPRGAALGGGPAGAAEHPRLRRPGQGPGVRGAVRHARLRPGQRPPAAVRGGPGGPLAPVPGHRECPGRVAPSPPSE